MLCKCPQLTPLQSRFVASLVALGLLGLVYWSLSSPHFAYAAELDHDGAGNLRGGEDHNWHRIQEDHLVADSVFGDEETLGHSLDSRQDSDDASPNAIGANDAADNLNIDAGETSEWLYPRELLMGPHADKGKGLPDNYIFLGKVEDVDLNVARKKRHVAQDDEDPTDLETRQAGREIFISINTCLQPVHSGTGTQSAPPPQLTLYVGQGSNKKPGPGSSGEQDTFPLDEGFASANITASGDTYMAVHAPQLPNDFTGGWNYEIAVSIDGYYHRYQQSGNNTPYLFLVDTDTNAALLVTGNLSIENDSSPVISAWMNMSSPFVMFAHNDNYTRTWGLEHSYCGLNTNAQIRGSQSDSGGLLSHVQMDMITRGVGDRPKQQFYVDALNASSLYHGSLAVPGNATNSGAGVVGGGGIVWPRMDWSTKADGNCRLMFNLDFCDKVAYAVPSNPATYPNLDTLAALYDSHAAAVYKNFTYTLDQIPCNTTSDAQYSLAKNCTDCANAYKEWLCAVTMPRCEDWSNTDPWLQMRNMGQPFINETTLPEELLNSQYPVMPGAPSLPGSPAFNQTYSSNLASNQSRNHGIIDLQIMPGPYKEVLPCEDLCYSLMQSCPAAMGFRCPARGRGLDAGYHRRETGPEIKCSFLGAVYYKNDARTIMPGVWTSIAAAALVGLLMGGC